MRASDRKVWRSNSIKAPLLFDTKGIRSLKRYDAPAKCLVRKRDCGAAVKRQNLVTAKIRFFKKIEFVVVLHGNK